MRILIVVDSEDNRLIYKKAADKIHEISAIDECSTAEDALFIAIAKQPDIVLCAGRLPRRSGLQLADAFGEIKHKALIIILTDDESFAIEAIKAKVFKFVIIPVNQQKLNNLFIEAIESIQTNNALMIENAISDEPMKVRISTRNGFVFVELDEIAYFEADGSYTNVSFIDGRKEFSSYNLGKIEKTLLPYSFARINRSVVVNLKLVKRIDKFNECCEIEVNGKNEYLKLSRTSLKRMELRNLL